MTAMRNSDNSIKVLRDAVDVWLIYSMISREIIFINKCAKLLEDKKTAALCLCNLGIMEGNKAYDEFMDSQQFEPEIEEWDDDPSQER